MRKTNTNKEDTVFKRIEYRIKYYFDKFLSNETDQTLIEKPNQIFLLTNDSRLLLLRHDRIGDLLVTVPFVKGLRNKFPDIQIDVLLSEKNISAKRAIDRYTDKFFVYKKNIFSLFNLLKVLKSRNYDIVIDLFDNPSTTSSILIKIIKPLYSLGFEKSNSFIYSHIVPLPDKNAYHIIERIAMLLMPFGISLHKKDLSLEFRLKNKEIEVAKSLIISKNGNRILGINLSGSNRSKYWGTDNIIIFIQKFLSSFEGFEIIIFSTPDYNSELKQIEDKTKIKIAPKNSTFVQFASYISQCDYILTPDTSVVHLCSAFKVPCVSLHLWTGSADTGLPWAAFNIPNICLKSNTDELSCIAVDLVIDSFNQLIIND